MSERIKLVVLDNHTLGYLINETTIGVLHASVLKGSPRAGSPLSAMNPILTNEDSNIRLASQKDFNDFNVYMGRFANKNEYEFTD